MSTDTSPASPNYVVVLADDLGACDLGCYGNADARTPRLDWLAAHSIRHEAFYVTPVCAPTRAAFLTGRHHLRTGVAGVHGGKDHIHLSEVLLPEVLQTAGYATGMWGKWHSGNSEGYLPHQRGFDEALLLELYRHRNPVGQRNGGDTVTYDGQWGDDVIVDAALDFARRHQDRPFFGLVASMTPHGPLDAPEEEIVALAEHLGVISRRLATLHAQVARLDQAVGRLLDGLKALDTGGRETWLLFFSDNGPAMFEDEFTEEDRARRNVLNWRGWKGDVWEGGIRSPLFLHRVGRVEAAQVVQQPADVTDLLPTLVSWAGATLASDHPPLDGRDLSPMLRGEIMPERTIHAWVHPAIPPYPNRGEARLVQEEYQPVTPTEKASMRSDAQVMALREGAWKLTRNADLNHPGGANPPEFLGNLVEDPCERRNRGEECPEKMAALAAQMDAWWESLRSESNAFAPPLIRIRAEGLVAFRATTAASMSGDLRNTVPAIEGFRHAGQWARWSLEAEVTRYLQPELGWHGTAKLSPGTAFKLTCSGCQVTGTTDANGSLEWSGLLCIDAGPNTLELTLTTTMRDSFEPLRLGYIRLGNAIVDRHSTSN